MHIFLYLKQGELICIITNSPIESFNRTSKLDFSLRRRFSVLATIEVIRRIIKVYSKLDDSQNFIRTAPVSDKTLKDKAKLISENMFKKCLGKNKHLAYKLLVQKVTREGIFLRSSLSDMQMKPLHKEQTFFSSI